MKAYGQTNETITIIYRRLHCWYGKCDIFKEEDKMNYCTISGTIVGDIDTELDREMRCCKFNIKNLYWKQTVSAMEKTIIRCICYGALAEYVSNELYDGANVLVTGRIVSRHYVVNNTHLDRLYIGCNTVTRLEQEEYD